MQDNSLTFLINIVNSLYGSYIYVEKPRLCVRQSQYASTE